MITLLRDLGRTGIGAFESLGRSALLFLYRVVLEQELPWLDDMVRPTRPPRVPTLLSREEVRRLLGLIDGVHRLMAGTLTARACVSWNACACG